MSVYIEWVQQSLKAIGYDPGPVDGVNGEKTDAAIRKFQEEHGLVPDGIVGDITHNFLKVVQYVDWSSPDRQNHLVLKNFTADEFACECGCGLDVCDRLKLFAQSLRDFFGWPLVISSGARCPPVNQAVGGVPDSCHLTGEAFDAYFPDHMNDEVIAQMSDFAISQGFGVISYHSQLFCHFQIPPRSEAVF